MPLGTSIVVSWSMIRPPPPPPRSCVKGAKRVRTAGRNADGAGELGGWGGGGDRRTSDPPAAPAATRKQPSTRIRIVMARA